MDATLIIPSFIAGLLTFLAPCTLPLVPGYLGFISGSAKSDLQNSTNQQIKRKIFLNGLFFVIGFTLVFIAFGTLAGLIGSTILAPYRLWLSRLGGILVILFGLFMLGWLKIPFLARGMIHLSKFKSLKKGKPVTSLLLGSAFAAGWTPCVGPVLGSILLLASSKATALQGGLMLTVFSAGLALPFLVIAAAFGRVWQSINKLTRFLKPISFIGGLFLIGLGILLILNKFSLLLSWSFRLLEFINYEGLVKYL